MSQPKPYLSLYTYDQNKQEITHLSVNDKEQITVEGYEIWESLLPGIKEKATNHSLAINKNPRLEEPQIILLFLKSKDLAIPDFFDCLAQSKMIRPYVGPHQRNQKQDRIYHPIITISYTDITHLHAEEKDDERQREWNNTIYKTFTLDPRYKVLDSSIWHRYVSVFPYKDSFGNIFFEVLKDIISYHQDGLYYTNSANISLEFQMRMLLHSYVARFGDKGHYEVITPFKFHSEWQMKKKSEEEIKFLNKIWSGKSLAGALRWRVLIVDDQAKAELSCISSEGFDYKCCLSKEDLIKKPFIVLYEERKRKLNLNKKLDIDASSSEDNIIEFSIDNISNKVYDIIFIDYLLGSNTKENRREYGHEFLLKLLEDFRAIPPKFQRGFFGKYWIFPISSYPYALADKLSQLGISHLHEVWHLSQGGDPLSTPHLYAHNLYRFIKQKVSKFFLYPAAMRRFFHQIPLNEENLQDNKWKRVLKQAINNGDRKLEILKEIPFDKQKSSLFVASIIKFLNRQQERYLSAVFKNILQIIDLLDDEPSLVRNKKIVGLLSASIEAEGMPKSYSESLMTFHYRISNIMNSNLKELKNRIKRNKERKTPQLAINNLDLVMLDEHSANEIYIDTEQIDLSRNKLSHLSKNFINLKKLEVINLGYNQFSDFPDVLLNLAKLREINLRHNKIEYLPNSIINAFPNLKTINLEDNPIADNLFIKKVEDNPALIKALWKELEQQLKLT